MADQLKQALLRRREVEARTTLARSTLYQKLRAGTFPRPIRIGLRSVAWRAHEVDEWLANPTGYRAPESV